jgi:outer membrane protein assembly factor BamB
MSVDVNSLVFVGLNGRVAALNRRSGTTVWTWKAPKPRGWTTGYVSLLVLDEKQLIASVNGYTYCLDPRTGREQWSNELPGFGTGVTSIAALGRHNSNDVVVAAAAADDARRSESNTE